MPVRLTIQNQSAQEYVPRGKEIKAWMECALTALKTPVEITVRIVDEEEGTKLNEQWRKGKGPTNVLSFQVEGVADIAPDLLGDIVICAPVVEREAKQQGKSLRAHWAHMVIHGTLHLLGYDHIDEREAELMESLEIEILEKIGFENPYYN